MTTEPQQPLNVYLIYAQKDEPLKQEFEDYLTILQQEGLISAWVERQVQPGQDWSQVIDPRLSLAQLVLLLVSPALLASGYCSGAEFREVFERNKSQRNMILVPILLRHVNLAGHPLGSIQYAPGKPVTSWPDQSEAWLRIDQEIRALIKYSSQSST